MKLLKIVSCVAFVMAAAAVIFTAGSGTRVGGSGLDTRVLEFALNHPGQDSLVVSKSRHLIFYNRGGIPVRRAHHKGFDIEFPAPVAIGSGGINETPEGEYYICQKNPNSRYTLFLGISWPSVAVANRALELGQRLSVSDYRRIVSANLLRQTPPWDTPLGGTYGIHGAPTYMKAAVDAMERRDPGLIRVTKSDNTRGCIAVEHRVLRFLYANIDEGTPILILN